jgi:hypothetical protein
VSANKNSKNFINSRKHWFSGTSPFIKNAIFWCLTPILPPTQKILEAGAETSNLKSPAHNFDDVGIDVFLLCATMFL